MIRFGVVGAGRIAQTFSKAVKGTEESLYAIASRNIDKATQYQKDYGFEKVYGSYEALLEDPNVDCVYIATPHGLHYEHMMLALNHKKNILCEKSFTLNAKQTETVLNKAKENNLFVMEAMWTIFLPTIREVKKLVDSGVIGKITKIEAGFGFAIEDHRKDRLIDPKMGGGALLDLGVYPIHFANLFLGSPDHYETEVIMDPRGFDFSATYTFFYPGAKANLASSLAEQLDTTGYIYGTKGYIKIPDFWKAEQAFVYNQNNQLIRKIAHPHLVNGFEYEINEVARCLNENLKESPLLPHNITIEVMKQMDALKKTWGLKFPNE